MNKQQKIMVVGLTTALAVGAALFLTNIHRKRREALQRQEIADEGYETAFDILYPLKSQQVRYKVR